MTIAINTRFLLPNKIEGMGRFTYEIARRLVLSRPDDHFIFFFDRAYDPQFIFAKNITPVVLFPPTRHPTLIWLWFEMAVARALRRYKVNIFFSPDGYCCLNTRVKTVLVVHDLAFLHEPEHISRLQLAYYQYFMPKYLKKADFIFTVSHFSKKDIQQYYNISNKKIDVVYNDCSPAFKILQESDKQRIREKYADKKPYFFYVGAIQPRKNIHRLIAAFDLFKQETSDDIKLLLAGRWAWQTGEVKKAYENAQFNQDIHFLGYVSDDELPQLMGAAEVLTYLSLLEGFGIPLVEAMACGVPILTSNTSSLPEIGGEAAFCIDPHSIEIIAHSMKKIRNKPEFRQYLIEKGKIQRKKYDWDKSASKIASVF